MIEREPLTVVVSQKGWIRALKGQVADLSTATFKGDDALKTSFFAETTSKILVLASDGKVFTLDAAKLPGGRGQGEPIRLMADIDESAVDRRRLGLTRRATKRLIVASDGNGFIVGEDDLLSSTRKGRAVLNVSGDGDRGADRPGRRRPCRGDRREPQAPGLPGRPAHRDGARQGHAAPALQGRRRLRRQGRSRSPTASPGATRPAAPSPSRMPELKEWIGNRAEAGRLPPKGFPKSNRFEG